MPGEEEFGEAIDLSETERRLDSDMIASFESSQKVGGQSQLLRELRRTGGMLLSGQAVLGERPIVAVPEAQAARVAVPVWAAGLHTGRKVDEVQRPLADGIIDLSVRMNS